MNATSSGKGLMVNSLVGGNEAWGYIKIENFLTN
jgi:hypothetical protein